MNTELTHVVGGALKGTAGLLNFARGLNPTDPYNLTHPAAYAQNVSMTLSGLVSTAAHRGDLTAAVDGFKKDPSEFIGRLIPELIGTKGAGLARGGLRLGLKKGLEEGAETPCAGKPATRLDPIHTPRRGGRVSGPAKRTRWMLLRAACCFSQTDISLPAVLPLVFKREFASSYRAGRWFGPSWSSTIDQRLGIDSEGIVYVGEDGLLLTYPHPAPDVPTLPTHGSMRWPLDRTDTGYLLTDPDGDACGTSRTTATTSHYSSRSTTATGTTPSSSTTTWVLHAPSPTAAATTFTLTCAAGRVRALSLAGAGPDGADQEVLRYAYSGEGHLTEVTNSCGRPTRFGYDEGAHHLLDRHQPPILRLRLRRAGSLHPSVR